MCAIRGLPSHVSLLIHMTVDIQSSENNTAIFIHDIGYAHILYSTWVNSISWVNSIIQT